MESVSPMTTPNLSARTRPKTIPGLCLLSKSIDPRTSLSESPETRGILLVSSPLILTTRLTFFDTMSAFPPTNGEHAFT